MSDRPALDFRRAADVFDPDWYVATYDDLPLAVARSGAVMSHYILHGWKEGRRPNADFDLVD